MLDECIASATLWLIELSKPRYHNYEWPIGYWVDDIIMLRPSGSTTLIMMRPSCEKREREKRENVWTENAWTDTMGYSGRPPDYTML